MSCPTFEELVAARAALADRTVDDACEQVLEHVARCARCAERLRLLELAESALRAGPLPTVPPDALHRAVAATASHAPAPMLRANRTRSDALAPAVRGEALAEVRETFAIGQIRIDCTYMEPSTVVGQVRLAPGAAPQDVGGIGCVLCGVDADGNERVWQTLTESNGDFRIEGVMPGLYDLIVELDLGHVVAADTRLGPRPAPSADNGDGG